MRQLKPRIRMFAGPNGSGKSTIKDYLLPRQIGAYLNADELEKVLNQTQILNLDTYHESLDSIRLINFLKTKDEDLNNAGFLHFRYNYKLKKNWVRWEAFTQVQFNKANGLRLRFLIGTGPRFKLIQKEKFKTYIGALYMY